MKPVIVAAGIDVQTALSIANKAWMRFIHEEWNADSFTGIDPDYAEIRVANMIREDIAIGAALGDAMSSIETL